MKKFIAVWLLYIILVFCYAQTQSLSNTIYHSLDALGWFLLCMGWIFYWLMKIRTEKTNRKELFSLLIFFDYNIWEIIISWLAAFLLAIISSDIPADIIDVHGHISIVLIGYSSTSILNGLLSSRRTVDPKAPNENYPGAEPKQPTE